MRYRLLIILAIVLLSSLLPVRAHAQDCNTVTTGTVDDITYDFPEDNIDQKLVRWLDGTLWTAVAKDYGLAHQVHVYYSIDNGLNWVLSYRTSEGNDGAASPVLSTSSNNDLCLLYTADDGSYWDLKGAMYDYSTDTWTNDGLIYDNLVASVAIDVDSNDTFHAAFFKYISGCSHRIFYITRAYLGNGVWDSWSAEYELESAACIGGVGIAISQENDVGIIYGTIYSNIYDESTGNWTKQKVNDSAGDWDYYPDIMATIRGGVTYWIAAWQKRWDGSSNIIYVAEKTGAAEWSSEASAGIGHTSPYTNGRGTLAQEQGAAGTTDTGNFFVLHNEPDGTVDYNEYEVGTGFLGVNTTSCSTGMLSGIYATKTLFPYNESVGWHWNLQGDDFAMVYYDQGSDSGWDDGDELIRYWDSSSSWGSFRPMVETGEPSNITGSTATFNGEIITTGGDNPTTIGWQYGHTQTATWTESLSGNFSAGAYSVNITALDGDEVYYCRFYATNSEGTTYGDWVGFITIQPSYDTFPDSDDSTVDIVPPLPDEPSGWYVNPTFDNLPGTSIFNSIFNTTGYPISFFWYLILAMFITCLLLSGYWLSREKTIVVFLLGSVALGFFCSIGWLDWWMLIPWLIAGFTTLTMEKQPII